MPTDDLGVTVVDLPPPTGGPVLDPWRIRLRLELAGELRVPEVERGPAVTRSELMLWSLLEHEPPGWQRAHSTGLYRLDFYCPSARLAVEVDGGSHYGQQAAERDRLRDAWHEARGITTKRFSACEVERQPEWVLGVIRQLLGTGGAGRAPEGQALAPVVAPGAFGLLDQAQQIAERLRGMMVLAEDVYPEALEGLRAEQRIEAAFAEACRTVLPEQASVMRQIAELFDF